MLTIYKRELRSYFTGMTGFVFIAFLMLMTGIYSTALNFRQAYPTFEYALESTIIIFLLVVPILTMRSFADEKHQKTDQLLYSLPLSMKSIVIGKYLAMVTILFITCCIMSLIPLILSIYGTVHFAATYISLFAFFLLGASLISIGIFMSSLTESLVISAVLTFAALLLCNLMSGLATLIPSSALASFIAFTVLVLLFAFLCYYVTKSSVISYAVAIVLQGTLFIVYAIDSTVFEKLFPNMMLKISLFDRLSNFVSGIFDLSSVIYYLSVIFLFIFFTIQSMEKKRWS